MEQPSVTVERLGKAYRRGVAPAEGDTLRDLLGRLVGGGKRHRPGAGVPAAGRDPAGTFWAVRDASFVVNRGEVLGLVGRNGSGKSTLLKMLSRITEPTEGRAVLRGRVASLLEVGTGFHRELTGRENVYLNGAILGMGRREVARKFGEIVEFAGVGEALDTPVKHYSSGMYVRLAFAVAAHLDPDILIVDEVLAVGDLAFQQRCLGKMGDAVRQGRTVLFVSHSMDAVSTMCTHVVVVSGGGVSERLAPDEGVKRYVAQGNDGAGLPLSRKPRVQDVPRPPVFTALSITTDTGHDRVVGTGGSVTFDVVAENCPDVRSATCAVALTNQRGQRVAFFHTWYHAGVRFDGFRRAGFRCVVPSLPVVPGRYHVELVLADESRMIEKVERADHLDVVFADLLGTGRLPVASQGCVVLAARWDHTLEPGS